MPMVNSKEMFKKAYEGGYAIGAFNVNNMEIIQGITEGAKMENAPLILQVSAGARKYAKHVYLMKMIEAAIEDTDLPIVVHLDHGPDFETCKSCIDGGFTSVMIDGSHLPFEENIALTRKVVEYAHDRNVTVEAELGRLAGVEDDVKVSAEDSSYTRPEEVEEFATRTGCDSLAIAIGTSHGAFKFKGEPKLRFDILEEVSKRLPGFPIVLHGASSVIPSYVDMINKYGGNMPGAQGVPEAMLRKAASMAVCKINIDSDLRLAFTGEIRKHLAEHPDHFDPRQYLTDARNGIREMVRHKIVDVLGCNGKAKSFLKKHKRGATSLSRRHFFFATQSNAPAVRLMDESALEQKEGKPVTREDFEGRVLDAREKLYRVARSYLQGEQDCLDAVSEAVLRAWQKRSTLRREEYFDTWLMRILMRECVNIQRRQKRVVPVESVPEMPAPDGSAAALRDALDALPQKLRTVTVLHYMEGYDVSELSRLLHIPKGTVTSRLHMARGRLREILKEDIE